ncbi:hypothetical protein SAMN06269301_3391 [Geobacter sp. DSM 9736]|nr:hypothetical protein SAMN06269301_3391 [Geobacter sp. DSM 9736]
MRQDGHASFFVLKQESGMVVSIKISAMRTFRVFSFVCIAGLGRTGI